MVIGAMTFFGEKDYQQLLIIKGLTAKIGIKTKIINLKPSITLSYLAPFGLPIINPQVQPPWPDLAIAAGRKTIPYLRYIRKVSMKKCKTIYLQDPRIKSKNFDIVWAPKHDSVRGPNVINTVTSPNRVNEKLLNYLSLRMKKMIKLNLYLKVQYMCMFHVVCGNFCSRL